MKISWTSLFIRFIYEDEPFQISVIQAEGRGGGVGKIIV